jgi:hypothetical protein
MMMMMMMMVARMRSDMHTWYIYIITDLSPCAGAAAAHTRSLTHSLTHSLPHKHTHMQSVTHTPRAMSSLRARKARSPPAWWKQQR